MAHIRNCCVYFALLIIVCSHAAISVERNSNVYTLLFGDKTNIANLHKEVKNLREKLSEHRQSLSNLRNNYASLQKRLENLEITQKRQSNDNILQKLQKYIVLKLNAQSKELVQKQSDYKKTIQDLFETQMKTYKKELKKFETKLLQEMQSELAKQKHCTQESDKNKKQIDKKAHKTLINLLTNLKNKPEEILKLPPEAIALLIDIGNIIEVYTDEEKLPSYATYVPNTYDKTVVVNAQPKVGVETASSCHEAIKSKQAVESEEATTAGGIYALNMTKYNLNNMYGYCLPGPNGDETWLLIQRRISDELSFNRNWQEYKNGFGDLTGSFFIGLERLHKLLLGSNSQLWIQLGTATNDSPYRMYANFLIANETEQYRLVSLDIENLRDDLVNAKDWSFQTFDVGNDCAKTMQSGWWYNETKEQDVCSSGNLHTKLTNVLWNSWEDVVYVHMAIRHVDPALEVHISLE
ncbi:angiopoietin-related protein 7-like [Bactrocera tryoni]|uniref:angiopoietin-related protein 7-like n=1 Tax=Bactrocera tryoni TaxID=59916 RepID=UPI001A9A1FDA|nr:angiopoietin-related protein 7-like [Bactrocera tryoni]